MTTSWFEDLFGFRESSYDETRSTLEVAGTSLRSRVNQRSYVIGELTTPSLRELRDGAAPFTEALRGRLEVSSVCGDVRSMHAGCGVRLATIDSPYQGPPQMKLSAASALPEPTYAATCG
jgi:hypothetical protein